MNKIMALLMLTISFVGCNSSGSPALSTTSTQTTSTTGTTPSDPVSTIKNLPVINDDNGNLVAYVVGLESDGFLLLYIVTANEYAYVNSQTGLYGVDSNVTFYYTEANCTGTVAAEGWLGEMGKTILFNGSNYFLVSGEYNAGQVFSEESSSNTGGCSNFTGTYTMSQGSAKLTAATQPYNFASIAPLNLSF